MRSHAHPWFAEHRWALATEEPSPWWLEYGGDYSNGPAGWAWTPPQGAYAWTADHLEAVARRLRRLEAGVWHALPDGL